jgi:hypothetical protein
MMGIETQRDVNSIDRVSQTARKGNALLSGRGNICTASESIAAEADNHGGGEVDWFDLDCQ